MEQLAGFLFPTDFRLHRLQGEKNILGEKDQGDSQGDDTGAEDHGHDQAGINLGGCQDKQDQNQDGGEQDADGAGEDRGPDEAAAMDEDFHLLIDIPFAGIGASRTLP